MYLLKIILSTLFIMAPCCLSISAENLIRANHPYISYMGRIHWNDNGYGAFTYPGTTSLIRFSGSSLKMETSPGSGKFVVEIDNRAPQTITCQPTDSILNLAHGLIDTIHDVRITYAIEGFEYHPEFRSFLTDGYILPTKHDPRLKIEFIGNSITCGYGIEDDNPQNPFTYDTENHTLSYAYLTARALNADFNVVARSGIGIYRNYGGPIEGDAMNMPAEYDYTLLYDHRYNWDFSRFIPDIICINLGTNDVSENNYDITLYESAYRAFLQRLHGVYPKSKIVLLTGSMLQGETLDEIRNVLDRLAAESEFCYRFDMSPQTGALGYGAGYHPSRLQAQKMAAELTGFLSGLLNGRDNFQSSSSSW